MTATPELSASWAEYHAALEDMRLKMEATPRFRETPQHRCQGVSRVDGDAGDGVHVRPRHVC